jgi:hypothetical protein
MMPPSIGTKKHTFGAFSISLLVHGGLLLMVSSVVILQKTVPKVPFIGEVLDAVSVPVAALPEILEEPSGPPNPDIDTGPPNPTTSSSIPSLQGQPDYTSQIIQTSAPSVGFSMPTLGSSSISSIGSIGAKGGGGVTGTPGKTVAKIFGTTIEASKLGVVFDVSFSTHATIDVALNEIEKSFPDAVIVLSPGCGMADAAKGKVLEGKAYMNDLKDYEYETAKFYMGTFLPKLLEKNKNFEKLWNKGLRENRMFVLHLEQPNKKTEFMINGTQLAFEFLEKQGVDTIWWMADFMDGITNDVADATAKSLKRRDITVYEHDFDGGKELEADAKKKIAIETGGQLIIGSKKQ